MRCLICKEEISEKPSWKSLLFVEKTLACDECYSMFNKITGSTCPICFRPQETALPCHDCEKWAADPEQCLQRNASVYTYNDGMKEVLALYKFRGDAVLAELFRKDLTDTYKKQFASHKLDYAIPIPLSSERLYERGFNQAKLLADFLPLPQLDILQRTDHEKQSKKSRHERLLASNVFSIQESDKIKEKQLLLVDDLYTTGSTLRHAAKTLVQAGARTVYSITLIRS